MARRAVPPAMKERRNCAECVMISNLNSTLKIGSQFGFALRPPCAKDRSTKEIRKK